MKPPKQLLNKWYQILKEQGFTDIEKDEDTLIEYHSTSFRNKHRKGGFEEKRRYYELAGQLLNTFPFTSKESKDIWKLHAAGMSVERIAKELKLGEGVVKGAISYLSGHIKYENHEKD